MLLYYLNHTLYLYTMASRINRKKLCKNFDEKRLFLHFLSPLLHHVWFSPFWKVNLYFICWFLLHHNFTKHRFHSLQKWGNWNLFIYFSFFDILEYDHISPSYVIPSITFITIHNITFPLYGILKKPFLHHLFTNEETVLSIISKLKHLHFLFSITTTCSHSFSIEGHHLFILPFSSYTTFFYFNLHLQPNGQLKTFNCNNSVIVMKTTYRINIDAPNVLVIFHLLKPIVITTASNIINSNIVEQKSPEFWTTTSLKLVDMLKASQGNGNLNQNININRIQF